MNGPLRRVLDSRADIDPEKGKSTHEGVWFLQLSCDHVVVKPRRGFDAPLTARCADACTIRRRFYGFHVTPHGFLKDRRVLPVENNTGPASVVPYE